MKIIDKHAFMMAQKYAKSGNFTVGFNWLRKAYGL
jgi:hypothetical protein